MIFDEDVLKSPFGLTSFSLTTFDLLILRAFTLEMYLCIFFFVFKKYSFIYFACLYIYACVSWEPVL